MSGSVVEVVPSEPGGREFCSFMGGQTDGGRTLVGITPPVAAGFTGVLEDLSFFLDGFNGAVPTDFGNHVLSCRIYVDQAVGHMDDGDVLFSYDFALATETDPAFVSRKGNWSFVVPSGCALFFELVTDSSLGASVIFGANFRWKSFDIVL